MTNAYITNNGSNTVTVINTSTNAIITTITVGTGPFGSTISPDGTKAYITNFVSNTVSIINTSTNTVVNVIGVGTNPAGIAATPDGTKIYVANSGSNTVSVISTSTFTVIATIAVGNVPYGIAITPNSNKAYVVNTATSGGDTVSVINTSTNTVSSTISLTATNPYYVNINPSGTLAYVTHRNGGFPSGNGQITTINTSTDTIASNFSIGYGYNADCITFSPDGTVGYITVPNTSPSGTLIIINTASEAVTATISLGSSGVVTQGIAITLDGTQVYITCGALGASGEVLVFNTSSNTVTNIISVGIQPSSLGNFIQQIPQPVIPIGTSPTALIITPQGRLTLSNTLPVMITDMVAQSTVYYLPYNGATLPIYNGGQFVNYLLSSGGISLALDSNTGDTGYQEAGYLYDIFAFMNAGVLTLGTGPAWTNSTTRSNAISQLSGLWVNSAAITLRYGNASGNTTSVPAYEATYLGTMYATANGQTQFNIKPAAASGGSANIIGIYNAYNQKRMSSTCRDSASYSYGTASWRKMDNSTSNSVSFVDGLGQTNIAASLQVIAGTGYAGYGFQIGVNLNSTTATPDLVPVQVSPTGTAADNYLVCSVRESFGPALGFNYIQAMENAVSSTNVYFNT